MTLFARTFLPGYAARDVTTTLRVGLRKDYLPSVCCLPFVLSTDARLRVPAAALRAQRKHAPGGWRTFSLDGAAATKGWRRRGRRGGAHLRSLRQADVTAGRAWDSFLCLHCLPCFLLAICVDLETTAFTYVFWAHGLHRFHSAPTGCPAACHLPLPCLLPILLLWLFLFSADGQDVRCRVAYGRSRRVGSGRVLCPAAAPPRLPYRRAACRCRLLPACYLLPSTASACPARHHPPPTSPSPCLPAGSLVNSAMRV